jgi:hypothetical protein
MRLFRMVATALAVCTSAEGLAQVQAPVQVRPQLNQTVDKAGLFDWLFGPQQAPSPVPKPPPRDASPLVGGGTYRTMCVRLCDGFYFPISFATTRDKFSKDAGKCERQCPSHSRLFVYRNPGQSLDDMVDLRGEPYMKLATANRFKATYVADCTCQGNPWDQGTIARHQSYPPAQAAPAPAVDGFVQRRLAPAEPRPHARTR